MADGLAERVTATGLLEPGRPLVVLLSGGRDSVCLLGLAASRPGHHVRALHVAYGLRGAESDADEEHCRRLCASLGVPLRIERAALPVDAGNLHAWARDVRYAAGARAIAQDGALLAVAHTRSDQVETILYRLATSPGRRSLLGMPVRSGLLVRPLLAAGVTRAETAAWCREHGLQWREDTSNDDPRFARARVRERLLPALNAVDGRAEEAILRTAALLAEEGAALDAIAGRALGAGGSRIAASEFAQLPVAIQRIVLRRMAEAATGRSCPRAGARLEELLALGDGAIDLGDGARVVVTAAEIACVPTPPAPSGRGASLPPA